MNEIPKVSDAEWQVMNVVWEKSPITSSEIVEKLKAESKWSTTTIYTLISRLVNKKVLGIKEGSSPYICYPLISKEELRSHESKSFLQKVFKGSLNLMLCSFLDDNSLSQKEIDELKSILDKQKDKNGD